MPIYRGSGVAIVTPFKNDGSVNYDKLEELVNFHVDNHTDAIIIMGTTGECATLTEEEHITCIEKTVEFVKGRIPVIAGTGSNCTSTAAALTADAKRAGADAALVVSPYYNKSTQKGLIQHFSHIADAADIPVILYNIPSRTGVNITPETIAILVKTKSNIVGVKEATGDFSQVVRTMNLLDGNIEFYSGEDAMVIPLLSMGGLGVISVSANIIPKDVHDMVMAYLDGDREKAARMQWQQVPLVDALFCEVNPIPIKHAMNLMGMNAGPLRLPLCEMEETTLNRLKKAMTDYGLKING